MRFVNKKVAKRKPYLLSRHTVSKSVEVVTTDKIEENNNKKEKVMTTQEKINAASEILASQPVKKIKKDKGLIERTESSKTILTEDNKELLTD